MVVDELKNSVKFEPSYSCDMVTCDYLVRRCNAQVLMDTLSTDTCVLKAWETGGVKGFKYNYSVRSGFGSFFIGIEVFNDSGSCNVTVRLRFNPNKVGYSERFIYYHNRLLVYTNFDMIKPRSFDLAIDFPVNRLNCKLIKDRRNYSKIHNGSDDLTEYLGSNSKSGRVKLYNKTRESSLTFDLTRLEVTCDFACDINSIFPRVLICDSFTAPISITGTDRVLLYAVFEEPTLLTQLPRRKKDTISKLLDDIVGSYSLERSKYDSVYQYAISLCFNQLVYEPEFEFSVSDIFIESKINSSLLKNE